VLVESGALADSAVADAAAAVEDSAAKETTHGRREVGIIWS